MKKPTVAVFCMPEDGHFKLLRPVISGLVETGLAVIVFTDRRYGPEIERCGATLADLFAGRPLEAADGESVPVPCRYVSFAAHYAEHVLAELREIGPALVVYETFAVIGRLVGRLLGVPYVNVSPGHDYEPARYLAALLVDPRVSVSERCHHAVEVLRERHGMSDASPFSYITGLSPWLNLCCEPSAFLTEAERDVFEPIAFFGCVPDWRGTGDDGRIADAAREGPRGPRIYACFGTVVPRYFGPDAMAVFRALSECLDGMPEARALISLGGATIDDRARQALVRPNVQVVDYADQWAALSGADVFLTHHGVNSTHEAILRMVPMLSYPFFTDQPSLAERCRSFGIALPLTTTLRGPVGPAEVGAGLAAVAANRSGMAERLAEARSWEIDVMKARPAVLRRIADLAGAKAPGR